MNNPSNCDVLLLAAGFGKRLGLLTKETPKPLIEVAGKKLIDYNLEYLSSQGIKKIFINLHYQPHKIENYVKDGSRWGIEVNYSHEPVILDTGGAVKKISDKLFGERLLVFNSDIIIDKKFSLKTFIDFHLSLGSENLATLIVREDLKSEDYGSLGINEKNRIVKFLNFQAKDSVDYKKVMFTGISILEKKLLSNLPSEQIFSLTKDLFQKEIERGAILSGYLMKNYWCDAGTPERIKEVESHLLGVGFEK